MRVSIKEIVYNNHTKLTYEDGKYYVGQVNKNDKKNGFGIFHAADSTIIKAGEWIDDECISEMPIDLVNKILDGK